MNKVVLITGASAGIGKATAIHLAQNGYTVYAAARRIEMMQELKAFGIKPIMLDVTNFESAAACTHQILNEAGTIDILVNNAGFGSYGAIEDVQMDNARYQLEVNVMGAMRLVQLVLPGMRKAGSGKIVNISSVGGKVAGPLGGWYHASKFALEGLSDSLRNEVRGYGIDVIVIEPGATRSEWGDIALNSLLKISGETVYKDLATKTYQMFKRNSLKKPEALVIAELVKKAIEAKDPKTRYWAGYMASPVLFLKKILSDKLMDSVVMSQLK
jgi:short-subunit dehydrogenase